MNPRISLSAKPAAGQSGRPRCLPRTSCARGIDAARPARLAPRSFILTRRQRGAAGPSPRSFPALACIAGARDTIAVRDDETAGSSPPELPLGVTYSDPMTVEAQRSWADAGSPPPTRQQLQNRRRKRRYKQARRTDKMMQKTSDARRLTRYISMLKVQKRAAQIMEEVEAIRLGPDRQLLNLINYNAALSALVQLGEIGMARRMFAFIDEDYGADVVAVANMIRACGKAKELDEAFELLEGYENRLKNTAPRRLYIMLLNACAEAGDVRRARAMMHRIGIQERLLSKIRSSKEIVGSAGYDSCAAGPPPPSEPQANAEDGSSEGGSHRFKIGHFDMSSLLTQYNLLAKAYSNSSTPLDLFTFLEDMRASGVSPDRVTFNQLLVGAARAGGREGAAAAAQIMARMKGLAAACEDVSLLPDSISYSCALRAALGSATPVMDTQQLLSEIEDGLEIVVGGSIRRHRFYPDAVCLSTAIDVLCKLGQPEKAMDYMEWWQTKGRSASPRGQLSLMRAYAEKGDLEVVRFLHNRLTRKEIYGKEISGQLLYEANQTVSYARKKAIRRNTAFNIAMAAEAQSDPQNT